MGVAVGAIALVAVALGLAFSGSPATLPEGVRVAGADVGGLTPKAAKRDLERRSRALVNTPVTFTADGHAWRLRPSQLGISVNWGSAIVTALREGNGPVPVRGFLRLGVRIFGAEVAPAAEAYDAALNYELDRFARALDHPHREPALVLRGLTPIVVPGQAGQVLDRNAAARVVVQALASLTRSPHIALPVRVDPPRVNVADLETVAAQVRTAVSQPIRLAIGSTRFRLPRYRVAQFLDLPRGGTRDLRIGGPHANAFFVRLQKNLGRDPRDADFAVTAHGVRVVRGEDGRAVDVPATAERLLRAALSPINRVAPVVVKYTPPKLTTADAKAMGIHELVGSYTTIYGGDPNRIHNVQLVAHLLDHHLIAPGDEFSFNKTTGDRNAAKGFLEAPVIINGELGTGLGGGVCQVSTTTFNAAYEAGLEITARTNHALYISHYPLGRDATVNYPDTDLRFVNDTDHWLLLRTFVGAYSLTVSLYGTSPHRKVDSIVAPLVTTGPAPVKKVDDPTLFVGEKVLVNSGSPSLATHVERKVYDANGKLLYDNTWYSSYRGDYKIISVGTKPKPAVKKKPKPTTTGTVTTTTTSTTPTAANPTQP